MKRKVFPVSMAVLWGIVFSQAMQSVTLDVCTNILEHILETARLILVKEHKLYYTAYIGPLHT